MRQRDPELNSRWGTICTPTEMIAADGKKYKTLAATVEGILRIIQSIRRMKAISPDISVRKSLFHQVNLRVFMKMPLRHM